LKFGMEEAPPTAHAMCQTERDDDRHEAAKAHHKQMSVCVSRALENAAWTLDEFCKDDDARRAVWTEISECAQRMLEQLVAAGKQRGSGATEIDDTAAAAFVSAAEERDDEVPMPAPPPPPAAEEDEDEECDDAIPAPVTEISSALHTYLT